VGRPAGYVNDATGTQHVVYRGDADYNAINEVRRDGTGLHYTNLNLAAGEPRQASLPEAGTRQPTFSAPREPSTWCTAASTTTYTNCGRTHQAGAAAT
jgi:hypothetical protein